jgi:hypothetical protein
MDALIACYGDESSDSDSESSPSNPTLSYSEGHPSLPPQATKSREPFPEVCVQPLPPPPIDLLHPPNFFGMVGFKLIFLLVTRRRKEN